ncbi:hypothetical protein LCGC14_1488790 [marine sediment metagenome]|uniref:DUF5668 domain-containing protein n=1 Tax=marine sediment metagenome TaxID=412755 RepID=A0A0F9J7Z5_9ZZZZ
MRQMKLFNIGFTCGFFMTVGISLIIIDCIINNNNIGWFGVVLIILGFGIEHITKKYWLNGEEHEWRRT